MSEKILYTMDTLNYNRTEPQLKEEKLLFSSDFASVELSVVQEYSFNDLSIGGLRHRNENDYSIHPNLMWISQMNEEPVDESDMRLILSASRSDKKAPFTVNYTFQGNNTTSAIVRQPLYIESSMVNVGNIVIHTNAELASPKISSWFNAQASIPFLDKNVDKLNTKSELNVRGNLTILGNIVLHNDLSVHSIHVSSNFTVSTPSGNVSIFMDQLNNTGRIRIEDSQLSSQIQFDMPRGTFLVTEPDEIYIETSSDIQYTGAIQSIVLEQATLGPDYTRNTLDPNESYENIQIFQYNGNPNALNTSSKIMFLLEDPTNEFDLNVSSRFDVVFEGNVKMNEIYANSLYSNQIQGNHLEANRIVLDTLDIQEENVTNLEPLYIDYIEGNITGNILLLENNPQLVPTYTEPYEERILHPVMTTSLENCHLYYLVVSGTIQIHAPQYQFYLVNIETEYATRYEMSSVLNIPHGLYYIYSTSQWNQIKIEYSEHILDENIPSQLLRELTNKIDGMFVYSVSLNDNNKLDNVFGILSVVQNEPIHLSPNAFALNRLPFSDYFSWIKEQLQREEIVPDNGIYVSHLGRMTHVYLRRKDYLHSHSYSIFVNQLQYSLGRPIRRTEHQYIFEVNVVLENLQIIRCIRDNITELYFECSVVPTGIVNHEVYSSSIQMGIDKQFTKLGFTGTDILGKQMYRIDANNILSALPDELQNDRKGVVYKHYNWNLTIGSSNVGPTIHDKTFGIQDYQAVYDPIVKGQTFFQEIIPTEMDYVQMSYGPSAIFDEYTPFYQLSNEFTNPDSSFTRAYRASSMNIDFYIDGTQDTSPMVKQNENYYFIPSNRAISLFDECPREWSIVLEFDNEELEEETEILRLSFTEHHFLSKDRRYLSSLLPELDTPDILMTYRNGRYFITVKSITGGLGYSYETGIPQLLPETNRHLIVMDEPIVCIQDGLNCILINDISIPKHHIGFSIHYIVGEILKQSGPVTLERIGISPMYSMNPEDIFNKHSVFHHRGIGVSSSSLEIEYTHPEIPEQIVLDTLPGMEHRIYITCVAPGVSIAYNTTLTQGEPKYSALLDTGLNVISYGYHGIFIQSGSLTQELAFSFSIDNSLVERWTFQDTTYIERVYIEKKTNILAYTE